ncbi:uncharacterized protein V1510DRAFT_447281 [Dipodascopsis tothii]|uniref:uncharacterized protein n=1 Tax=Dipodascopsis tothii TaxID=44089 RepID=UPI0034CD1EDC
MEDTTESLNRAALHYKEAIRLARATQMDSLSDEYTGLEIALAAVLEKLEKFTQAIVIYADICSRYSEALDPSAQIFQSDTSFMENDDRDNLITRHLRVAVRASELLAYKLDRVTEAGLFLKKQIFMSQRYLNEVMSNLQNMQDKLALDDVNGLISTMRLCMIPKEDAVYVPYSTELFAARDLYVSLALETEDLNEALDTKFFTILMMHEMGASPIDILLTRCDVGSIYYLLAHKENTSSDEVGAPSLRNQGEHHIFYDISSLCFKDVLSSIAELRSGSGFLNTNEPSDLDDIDQATALAVYGLGSIAHDCGDYNRALELLREARLRCRGSNNAELLSHVEASLQKLGTDIDRHKGLEGNV